MASQQAYYLIDEQAVCKEYGLQPMHSGSKPGARKIAHTSQRNHIG
jgi:hypothetical protein